MRMTVMEMEKNNMVLFLSLLMKVLVRIRLIETKSPAKPRILLTNYVMLYSNLLSPVHTACVYVVGSIPVRP